MAFELQCGLRKGLSQSLSAKHWGWDGLRGIHQSQGRSCFCVPVIRSPYSNHPLTSRSPTKPMFPLPDIPQDQGPDNQGRPRCAPKPAGIMQSSPS